MDNKKTVRLNSVLEHAIKNSHIQEEYDRFKRIEQRYTKTNLDKLRLKLQSFRREGADLTSFALATEKHSSKQLGEFLRCIGFPRPGPRWEAHHIVSGTHKEASPARVILADKDI